MSLLTCDEKIDFDEFEITCLLETNFNVKGIKDKMSYPIDEEVEEEKVKNWKKYDELQNDASLKKKYVLIMGGELIAIGKDYKDVKDKIPDVCGHFIIRRVGIIHCGGARLVKRN